MLTTVFLLPIHKKIVTNFQKILTINNYLKYNFVKFMPN